MSMSTLFTHNPEDSPERKLESDHSKYKMREETVVASIARVISDLCAVRIRGMAYSDMDLASLGDAVDVRIFFSNLFFSTEKTSRVPLFPIWDTSPFVS